MRILLENESADGNGTSDQLTESQQVPAPSATPQPPAPAPAAAPAPTAAATVINGPITEETELLRVQLETERASRKKVEQDHASVSDEFKRYKDATEARREEPVPVKHGKVRVGLFR